MTKRRLDPRDIERARANGGVLFCERRMLVEGTDPGRTQDGGAARINYWLAVKEVLVKEHEIVRY